MPDSVLGRAEQLCDVLEALETRHQRDSHREIEIERAARAVAARLWQLHSKIHMLEEGVVRTILEQIQTKHREDMDVLRPVA